MSTSKTMKACIRVSLLLTFCCFLVAVSGCKKKSTDPKVIPAAPSLLTVIATCGPEILLNWTDNATNESGFKIERSTGGAFAQIATVAANSASFTDSTVAVSTEYLYRVRAYTSDGNSAFTNSDSATTGSGTSGAPDKVVALSGEWFKGAIGGSSITPSPVFAVHDAASNPVPGETIEFELLSGDGSIADSSVDVDNSCTATLGYTFDGSLGHAVIRATSGSVDSAIVNIRANMLIPGANLQGQYIINGDIYQNVVRLNGAPVSVDEDPNFWINYANYESTLGVVFVVDDPNHSTNADSSEAILGILVNTIYTGKTISNIGIGSSMSEVRAAFGTPTSITFDATPPPAVVIAYDDIGLTLFGTQADTTIFEIHLFPPVASPPPTVAKKTTKAVPFNSAERAYRLVR